MPDTDQVYVEHRPGQRIKLDKAHAEEYVKANPGTEIVGKAPPATERGAQQTGFGSAPVEVPEPEPEKVFGDPIWPDEKAAKSADKDAPEVAESGRSEPPAHEGDAEAAAKVKAPPKPRAKKG